jgi:hypothetical protein
LGEISHATATNTRPPVVTGPARLVEPHCVASAYVRRRLEMGGAVAPPKELLSHVDWHARVRVKRIASFFEALTSSCLRRPPHPNTVSAVAQALRLAPAKHDALLAAVVVGGTSLAHWP